MKIICPYCDRSLPEEFSACCGEVGHGVENKSPKSCVCGSTDFRWDKGFKGNSLTPPEPSGWYCAECESRDYGDFDQPMDVFEAIGLEPVGMPELSIRRKA